MVYLLQDFKTNSYRKYKISDLFKSENTPLSSFDFEFVEIL